MKKILLTAFALAVITAGYAQSNKVLSAFPAASKDALQASTRSMKKMSDADWKDLMNAAQSTDSATAVQFEYAIKAYSDFVMQPGEKKARKKLVSRYCEAIANPSFQQRRNFFLQQLQLVGNDQSVDCLAALINDPISGDHAVRALVSIGTDKAGKVLLSSVTNAHDQTKMNIITALGEMKYKPSADLIKAYAAGEQPVLAAMAMVALQKMNATDQLNSIQQQKDLAIIKEKLNGRSSAEGFTRMFNGKDLSGWKGLVANPIQRAKMSAEQLSQEQKKADSAMRSGWKVANELLVFTGHGDNLCSEKKYSDFEMLVDWKITKDGDAGIYLRGTPQVQIWDIARTDVGAQVGSGGLYNNQKNPSKPLVMADNPVGEWNAFHIIMKGDRVTVYLNNKLVVDNVVLENYWDRSQPIFPKEQIELQAHGTYVAYRNIYIKELN